MDILPPREFYEYGIWIPEDQFRDDSSVSSIEDIEQEISLHETPRELTEEELREIAIAKEREEQERKLKEKENAFRTRFNALGSGGTGISPAAAGVLAREEGYSPSQEDINRLRATKGENVSFEDFFEWLPTCVHPEDDVVHLTSFFRFYDKNGNGKLSKVQLRNLLAKYGEPLTDVEIDAILAEFGMTGDMIDYEEFVTRLLE